MFIYLLYAAKNVYGPKLLHITINHIHTTVVKVNRSPNTQLRMGSHEGDQ